MDTSAPAPRRWTPSRASGLLLLTTLVLAVGVRQVQAHEDPCEGMRQGDEAHAVYDKESHRLCVFSPRGVEVSVRAAHGRAHGPKRFEGDERTPEGWYRLRPARASARFSSFLPISYPNAADREHARAARRAPGGAIGLHGPGASFAWLGPLVTAADVSDGCIVVDRRGLDAVRRAVTRPLPFLILGED